MSPQPQFDQTGTVNNLAKDQAFLSLPKEEQQSILSHIFSLDPSNKQPILKQSPGESFTNDKFVDLLRMVLPPIAGTVAGLGVGASGLATGGVSSLAAPTADIGAYAGIDALLQKLKSSPPTTSDALLGGTVGGAVNYAGGKVLGAIGKGAEKTYQIFKGALPEAGIETLKPTTSQLLRSQGNNVLGGVSKFIEDVFSTGTKAKALDRTAGEGFSEALAQANRIMSDPDNALKNTFNFSGNPQQTSAIKLNVTQFSDPNVAFKKLEQYLPDVDMFNAESPISDFKKLDGIIKNPDKLQETLSRASELGTGYNLKRSLQGYQIGRMFNEAMISDVANPGMVKLDPQKLANMWTDPEMQSSLKTLYSAQNRSDISQFFKNVELTQDKLQSLPLAKSLWMVRGGIGIGADLLTGSLSGSALAGHGGMVGIFLGGNIVGKLLTNPKTSRILAAMAGGEPLGVSSQYAGRAIMGVLQGNPVSTINSDGSKTPGLIDDKGLFVPQN